MIKCHKVRRKHSRDPEEKRRYGGEFTPTIAPRNGTRSNAATINGRQKIMRRVQMSPAQFLKPKASA